MIWSFTTPPTATTPIPQLDSGIKSIPESAYHREFTLNVFACLPPQWVALEQRIIDFSLVHRIIPVPSKETTISLIPKGATTDIRPISLIDDIEVCRTIYIGQHLSAGFEVIDILPHYVNAYRKGKFLDDLTLTHILTLEDINQSAHCILAFISDDEEELFGRITLELLCTDSINMTITPPTMQNEMQNPSYSPKHISQASMTHSSSLFSVAHDKDQHYPIPSQMLSYYSKQELSSILHISHTAH